MHFYQQIIKNAIQVTGHYSVHIGLAPSFRLTGLKVSLQSGSIIIKNMYPRPTQLLCILPDIDRSKPYFNTLFPYSIAYTSYYILH